ncbi:uncharacterized protein LOC131426076 [Malaya genurostris]|uniref:uncharacterized protein LOC131426076 n=1 Tax=Malaya genurostris TaxID=325434 RepID=UPI0026F3E587|nr:uncharacterized protein LOC131426076 [Malaya genurostris]XP_058444492.1 uncharacterized protein LOC131426076 [Malaya genurostris]
MSNDQDRAVFTIYIKFLVRCKRRTAAATTRMIAIKVAIGNVTTMAHRTQLRRDQTIESVRPNVTVPLQISGGNTCGSDEEEPFEGYADAEIQRTIRRKRKHVVDESINVDTRRSKRVRLARAKDDFVYCVQMCTILNLDEDQDD